MRAALVLALLGSCAFAASLHAQPIIVPLSPQVQREPPPPPPPSAVPTVPPSTTGRAGSGADGQATGMTGSTAQDGTMQPAGAQSQPTRPSSESR